jgi:hypothetical protein
MPFHKRLPHKYYNKLLWNAMRDEYLIGAINL